ncbi:hypothetical protein H0H87_012306 [Tephrocybe sp. NHM501043]|nr:hypothetical protein H0H87_012306 [Tephrocybe sp. NHM501043]
MSAAATTTNTKDVTDISDTGAEAAQDKPNIPRLMRIMKGTTRYHAWEKAQQTAEKNHNVPRLMKIMKGSTRYQAWEEVQRFQRAKERNATATMVSPDSNKNTEVVFDAGSSSRGSADSSSLGRCTNTTRKHSSNKSTSSAGTGPKRGPLGQLPCTTLQASKKRTTPVIDTKYAHSHIIGEDDPFNPFSAALYYAGDMYARSIITPEGLKIVAPVPQRSLAIVEALKMFEDVVSGYT